MAVDAIDATAGVEAPDDGSDSSGAACTEEAKAKQRQSRRAHGRAALRINELETEAEREQGSGRTIEEGEEIERGEGQACIPPLSPRGARRSWPQRPKALPEWPGGRYPRLAMSAPWVSPRVLGPVVEFALEQGVPARQLERFVPLASQAPVSGVSAHALWAFVARSLDERALPWRVAGRMRPADYGPYGFALQASDSPREALVRAARFLPSIATTIEFHLTSNAHAARLTVRRCDAAEGRGARIGTTFIVGQIARMLEAISDGAITPSAIFLSEATAAEATDLAAMGRSLASGSGGAARSSAPRASASVERAATTSLELTSPSLDAPLPRRDPDLARYFDEQLLRHHDRSTRAAARRAVEEHFARGQLPTEERIAALLGCSCRTLRRHLAQEGTSLRDLLDDVRLERAAVELAHGELPLAELAAELGFSDQTAFTRAFSRWTGRAPGAYRRSTRRQR